MSEKEQFSSADLRLTQQVIKDIGDHQLTDIPYGFIGELIGKIEVTLAQRRELVPALGYTPDQIERASQVTESLLVGIDTEVEYYEADNALRKALILQKQQHLIARPEGLPAIPITSLKQLVQAELGQIKAVEEEIVTKDSKEIDGRAAMNVAIINSWFDNSHLGEYFNRRGLEFSIKRSKYSRFRYSCIDNKGLVSILACGVTGGIMGEMLHTGVFIGAILATLGMGVVSYSFFSSPVLMSISSKGVSETYENISRMWDAGDWQGSVTQLANLDRAKLATNLNRFIQKH